MFMVNIYYTLHISTPHQHNRVAIYNYTLYDTIEPCNQDLLQHQVGSKKNIILKTGSGRPPILPPPSPGKPWVAYFVLGRVGMSLRLNHFVGALESKDIFRARPGLKRLYSLAPENVLFASLNDIIM